MISLAQRLWSSGGQNSLAKIQIKKHIHINILIIFMTWFKINKLVFSCLSRKVMIIRFLFLSTIKFNIFRMQCIHHQNTICTGWRFRTVTEIYMPITDQQSDCVQFSLQFLEPLLLLYFC
jgi:hypothetical protein